MTKLCCRIHPDRFCCYCLEEICEECYSPHTILNSKGLCVKRGWISRFHAYTAGIGRDVLRSYEVDSKWNRRIISLGFLLNE